MKASVFLCLFAVAARAAAQTASPNETARFLAGLPTRGGALEGATHDPGWAEHASSFDAAWLRLEQRQLGDIRIWGPAYMREAYTSRDTMYYMFSGPDFLYAQAFFPNAKNYILCGTEPVGGVPDIGRMPANAVGPALAGLRRSLNNVLSFSFFITKDMRVDLTTNQFGGTVPILLVFLARSGSRVESVEMVSAGKSSPGVKISFFGPEGRPQTLYYFSSDLSDGPVNSSGFLKYCDQFGRGHSMLKAASYLMHQGNFNTVRNFLLSHSKTILQDDSGIPLRHLTSAGWKVRYFGNYSAPIALFKEHYQADLAEAYAKSNPPALYFGFGYHFAPQKSTVMLATPR